MKKFFFYLFLSTVIFLLSQGCLSQQAPLETEHSLSEYYPVSLQNKYIYKVTSHNTSKEEKRFYTECRQTEDGKLYWCMKSGEQTSTGFLSEKGLELASTNMITFSPPIHAIKSNPEEGDMLTTNIELSGPQSSKKIIVNCTVDRFETVETPAGKFTDCILFSLYFQTQDTESPGILQRRAWLARGIGMVKAQFFNPAGEILTDEIILSAEVGGKKIPG